MESLGYVLLYFLRGSLPWQGLRAKNIKQKYEKIKETKIKYSIQKICRGLPHEFYEFCYYIRHLKFNEKPDYSYLRSLFKKTFIDLQLEYDYAYDWTLAESDDRK